MSIVLFINCRTEIQKLVIMMVLVTPCRTDVNIVIIIIGAVMTFEQIDIQNCNHRDSFAGLSMQDTSPLKLINFADLSH